MNLSRNGLWHYDGDGVNEGGNQPPPPPRPLQLQLHLKAATIFKPHFTLQSEHIFRISQNDQYIEQLCGGEWKAVHKLPVAASLVLDAVSRDGIYYCDAYNNRDVSVYITQFTADEEFRDSVLGAFPFGYKRKFFDGEYITNGADTDRGTQIIYEPVCGATARRVASFVIPAEFEKFQRTAYRNKIFCMKWEGSCDEKRLLVLSLDVNTGEKEEHKTRISMRITKEGEIGVNVAGHQHAKGNGDLFTGTIPGFSDSLGHLPPTNILPSSSPQLSVIEKQKNNVIQKNKPKLVKEKRQLRLGEFDIPEFLQRSTHPKDKNVLHINFYSSFDADPLSVEIRIDETTLKKLSIEDISRRYFLMFREGVDSSGVKLRFIHEDKLINGSSTILALGNKNKTTVCVVCEGQNPVVPVDPITPSTTYKDAAEEPKSKVNEKVSTSSKDRKLTQEVEWLKKYVESEKEKLVNNGTVEDKLRQDLAELKKKYSKLLFLAMK